MVTNAGFFLLFTISTWYFCSICPFYVINLCINLIHDHNRRENLSETDCIYVSKGNKRDIKTSQSSILAIITTHLLFVLQISIFKLCDWGLSSSRCYCFVKINYFDSFTLKTKYDTNFDSMDNFLRRICARTQLRASITYSRLWFIKSVIIVVAQYDQLILITIICNVIKSLVFNIIK